LEHELQVSFQRRLSQCNRGELIVIMFDIYFAHTESAAQSYRQSDWEKCKDSLKKAINTLDMLMDALDFKYEIAGNLYSIYHYCKTLIYRAIATMRMDSVEEANRLLAKIKASFSEAAKQDNSESLMGNAQTVYAGYTYGRESINENISMGNNRGFLA